MGSSKKVHMYIGPRISDNMTISELNGARSLAKYIISKTFPSINSFNSFCNRFTSEQQLLKTIYKGYNMEDLCGEDLTTYLCMKAYDDNNNKVLIKYKKTTNIKKKVK